MLQNSLSGQVITTLRVSAGQNTLISAYGRGGAYYPYGWGAYNSPRNNSIELGEESFKI